MPTEVIDAAAREQIEADVMREYDENIRLYTPMLQRIIILVAVIIAVPVVLWTITAFVRSYVGPPQLPTFRPLAASQLPAQQNPPAVQVAAQTVNTASDARSPLLEIKKPVADAPQAAPSIAAPSTAAPAMSGAGAPPVPPPMQAAAIVAPAVPPSAASAPPVAAFAAPAGVPPPPFAAPSAAPATVAAPTNFALASAAPPQATTALFPNPAAAAPTDSGPDAQPASIGAPSEQMASNDTDDLPAGTPLKGKIPLPLRRPNVAPTSSASAHVALATGGTPLAAGIPLPRARPVSAPEAAPVSDTPNPAYDPSQIH